ncbi:hypothetical protein KRR38_23800 [Novosphingobium sp. G106]|uniref:hypothetical protein n=1 Tax=Novosphingobium sp. G106 TaxID=2849500 RepID=UPI001C2DB7F3|nr:hypothetical protein [Novosphingobium sp. G106]MBV1690618.1 hypothetical protein [Novosphingobium sp. G106]
MGVENIEFGENIESVRSKLPGEFETFYRILYPEDLKDPYPSDHFVDIGIFCYYNAGGNLEAMEFSEPARPILSGVDILNIPFRQAEALFEKLDADLVRDLGSVISERWSLAIMKPGRRSDPTEMFLAGRAGLYKDKP